MRTYVEAAENRSEVNKAVQSTSREGEWCNGYYTYEQIQLSI